MTKETKYQTEAQSFIEKQYESYNGKAINIYTEEFDSTYDSILQECSPLIGGKVDDSKYNYLKSQFGIVGLREKIKEFNESNIIDFLKKYKRKESIEQIVDIIFDNFKIKYEKAENEAELFQLIFTPNQELKSNLKREIVLQGLKEPLAYNVIYYENPTNYLGKNDFYTIREHRIPVVMHQYKKTERPDFLHYINGIPLVLVEYKTEDSGILQSLKDFEYKESYKKAPFKIALNDGRDVIFFSDLKSLKFKNGKDNSFNWVHYLPKKKYISNNQREFTNIEYLFDELFCQPENIYSYCVDGCSVVNSNSHYYLINARIQQYYALKDIKKTLVNAANGKLALPYNFEFAHAQRSGKTITMKLMIYMIENSFKKMFNTIFMYTPDLQIKDVINTELTKSGNSKISVKMVETRTEYQDIIDHLYKLEQEGKEPTGLVVYIVNMQKITDKELQDVSTRKIINSLKILNMIDEAHHGQTKETALIRDTIFPNASNYLFTATGKTSMYLYYFPDNNRTGFSNKFTISNAKECKITVPVMFLRAEKQFKLSDKLSLFASEVEKRLEQKYLAEGQLFGLSKEDLNSEDYLDFGNKKVSDEVKRALKQETISEKINAIVFFMNSVREGLPFSPKAIVYVNSVDDAKKYIEFIQAFNDNNEYQGYRFGVDFSSIEKICEKYNPGIKDPEQISANLLKDRTKENKDNKTIIDILFAVDKYQKGFDLPSLLVTFLDTNISEPARMNQIFTRSATKFNGKTIGYCVDLTFENINQETFKNSLLLYDNAEDFGDSFVDDDLLETLKEVLANQFKLLMKELNLTQQNFTASMILQQVLNEQDLKIRQNRQYSFFNISKNIVANLSKMGSPLFFKPFALELRALTDAFAEFRTIYADKIHPEHSKILINTDISLEDGKYITNEEIKSVIAEVLFFLKENHIRDIISFDYTNKHNEVKVDEDAKQEVIQKFTQELKKNNLEKDLSNLDDYLFRNHKELFEMIKYMLAKISDDRSLIYQEVTQQKIVDIENELALVKEKIADDIQAKFGGNSFLFWSNQVGNQIFESYGIHQEDFITYLSSEVNNSMKIVLPQIERDLSNFNKVQISIEMFKDKTDAQTFSFYLTDFNKKYGMSDLFIEQIKKSPKIEGEVLTVNKELFSKYLNQTLRQYYQNIIKD